ncbi:MAG: right-handed parallel beta-helix repeat-containing protein [Oscillospiraceae bacterium]|nr:right-handed parallel beta-helix repeat-containing protein [Oscillospiraceae bacterium]
MLITEIPAVYDNTCTVGGRAEDTFPDLQAALAAAGENRLRGKSTRILVRGGVYRAPVRFDGAAFDTGGETPFIAVEAMPGERPVFSGAVPVEGWRLDAEERVWRAQLPKEARYALTHRDGEAFTQDWGERAWCNSGVHNPGGMFYNGMLTFGGALYSPVPGRTRFVPGTFLLDLDAGTITVSPLAGELAAPAVGELAAKTSPVVLENLRNMVLRGLHVTGCGWALTAAMVIEGAENIWMDQCSVNRNRYCGLQTNKVRHCLFTNLDMIENGAVGGGGSWRGYIRSCTYRGLVVAGNNWIEEKFGWTDYDPCGLKWAAMRDVLVESCVFSANRGEGLWFDTENRRVTVRNCRFINNLNAGIMLEANMGPFLIADCEMAGNNKGVFFAATNDVTLERCHIHWNKFAIDIYDHSSRPDRAHGRGPHPERSADFPSIDDGGIWESHTVNTVVRDCRVEAHPRYNFPFYTHNTYSEGWRNDETGYRNFVATLQASGNAYCTAKPAQAFLLNSTQTGALEEWQLVSGADQGSVLSGFEKQGAPPSPEPL